VLYPIVRGRKGKRSETVWNGIDSAMKRSQPSALFGIREFYEVIQFPDF
jgi:hypothetical protein